jgi:phytoene synthase
MAMPSFTSSPPQAADRAACRALLRGGSRSFHLASYLLPARERAAATALYAFCRLADDTIDLHPEAAASGLAELHTQLDRVYAGHPRPLPMERQFAAVVHDYQIPRALLEALMQGFEWDAEGRGYADLPSLQAYAARVAGSVGVLMTLLMGVREAAVLARAADLGIAMQLTNIARDVGQDARAGRLYLPADWLSEAGIDATRWRLRPVFTPALGAVIERLLGAADALYAHAAAGIAHLPLACRPGIHAARLLYAEIGHELRRRGLDSVSYRAHVGGVRKARLLGVALRAAAAARTALPYAPLEQARFLIDAVTSMPQPAPAHAPVAAARPQSNAEWLIELFQRLQERDQRAGIDALSVR